MSCSFSRPELTQSSWTQIRVRTRRITVVPYVLDGFIFEENRYFNDVYPLSDFFRFPVFETSHFIPTRRQQHPHNVRDSL